MIVCTDSMHGFDDTSVEATDAAGTIWRWFRGNDDDGDGFNSPAFAAVSDDGRINHFNWSRFGGFDAGHFRMYVELGFPASPARNWGDGVARHSPWQPDELAQVHAAQRAAHTINPAGTPCDERITRAEYFARMAGEIADAMLAERSKP